MEKKLSKNGFLNKISSSLDDVRNKQDCIDWWNSYIDAYIEDKIIGENAKNWKNPFVKNFKNRRDRYGTNKK